MSGEQMMPVEPEELTIKANELDAVTAMLYAAPKKLRLVMAPAPVSYIRLCVCLQAAWLNVASTR